MKDTLTLVVGIAAVIGIPWMIVRTVRNAWAGEQERQARIRAAREAAGHPQPVPTRRRRILDRLLLIGAALATLVGIAAIADALGISEAAVVRTAIAFLALVALYHSRRTERDAQETLQRADRLIKEAKAEIPSDSRIPDI